MGHADIEEEIVERGVHQRKGKDESPVARLARSEGTPITACHGEDYQPGRSKADAGKEHLAARHVGGNAKGAKAQFDEREGPSPRYRCRQGKDRHPCGALKYGSPRLFHYLPPQKKPL